MPKLILSRKGFDSGTGGKPSPILGNRLISLPIPQAGTGVFYKDYTFDQKRSYLRAMQELGITFYSEMHPDPDLEATLQPRLEGWRPVSGQHGASWSHLMHEGIGQGDIFLFFGWFKAVEEHKNGKLRYVKGTPDLHIIYGYLEVDHVIDLNTSPPPSWAVYHPHVVFKDAWHNQGNGLFIAKENSALLPGLPGAGVFPYDHKRVLTHASPGNQLRSQWRLPSCFFKKGLCQLSYHRKRKGVKIKNEPAYLLQSVGRGQEFVIEINDGIRNWLREICL